MIRTWETTNADEAFKQHLKFKQELTEANFQIHKSQEPDNYTPKYLLESAQMYLDYLADIDVPQYSKKLLSDQYLKGQALYIERFLKHIKVGRLSDFPIEHVSEKHVNHFHIWVESKEFSSSTYNMHMQSIRYFFQWLIDQHKIDMVNPLRSVKSKPVAYSKTIVTESEFQTLLDHVTQANAWGEKGKGKNKIRVNYYRPWIKDAFKLAILTGERLSGVVQMKWKHVQENHLIIPNWKVNARQNSDSFTSYTFITSDLAELLARLVPADPESYILEPDWANRKTLIKLISKSFTHFWRKTGIDKQVSFKNLRKTYITRVFDLIGDKAKTLKHTNDETALRHYMNEKEIVSKMQGMRMYNFE